MIIVKRLLLIVILGAGLVAFGCQTANEPPDGESPPDNVIGVRIGNIAPDFTLKDLDGQTVSLNDYRGRPVLVNFWATWCTYCVIELPYLQQTYEKWMDRGLAVLAVDSGETRSRVEGFLKDIDLSMTVLLDTDETVSREYVITAYPTTYFIDKDGIIQEKVVGAFPNIREIEKRLVKIVP